MLLNDTIDFKQLSEREKGLHNRGYHYTGFYTRVCSHKDCHHRFRVAAPLLGYRQVVETPCPKCAWVSKKPWLCKAERIWGRLNEGHACSAKCENAKGPSCDCACGGENHGVSHGGGPTISTENVPVLQPTH
ncbi:MAG: hypothetical protein V4498_02835 [candidate division FCPU426 bacterium]